MVVVCLRWCSSCLASHRGQFLSLLFVLYTVEVLHIIASCGLIAHCNADDTQLYISVLVSAASEAAARLAKCVERLDLWMAQNRLKLNTDKTQLM